MRTYADPVLCPPAHLAEDVGGDLEVLDVWRHRDVDELELADVADDLQLLTHLRGDGIGNWPIED